MTPIQDLELRRSAIRQELGELGQTEGDEAIPRIEELEAEYRSTEPKLRALKFAEDDVAQVGDAVDSDKLELRSRVSVHDWMRAEAKGQKLTGAIKEYAVEMGCEQGHIPLEALEPVEMRADVTTKGPTANTGVNVFGPTVPYVFETSVAPMLGIDMPMVGSGAANYPRITTALAAGSRGVDAAAESTRAGVMTIETTEPHYVSARVRLRWADTLTIGVADWEQAWRQHLRMSLGNELDDLLLKGDPSGTATDPKGLLPAIGSAPTDPTAVASWDDYVALAADRIDGLWATGLDSVRLLANHKVVRAAEKTYLVKGASDTENAASTTSAASYLRAEAAGFMGRARMPDDTTTKVGQVVAFRTGAAITAPGRISICPTWGSLEIADIMTDSASAIANVTLHVAVGDVLVLQAGAYARASIKYAS